ncbi:hypothetical protein EUX98_g5212 [Antrodiella citrinella]|uniref:Protein kinase domain-containing protein n=1 Tax=Antrodiella citrinella TaxID=2447956 RepID=A0A4S4MS94_9APHY|nr:hypothetical protein EUX98_g5212 [Antrodiella citrinella]
MRNIKIEITKALSDITARVRRADKGSRSKKPKPQSHLDSQSVSIIPHRILILLDDSNPSLKTLTALPEETAQSTLTQICQLLSSAGNELSTAYQICLRRLSLKLAITYCVCPTGLKLEGVQRERRQPMMGAFAQVFCGTYDDNIVAIKKVRVPHKATVVEKKVSTDLLCQGHLKGNDFVVAVHEWLRQSARGLAFLHEQDIVHGDIHAGNILIDDAGQVRLTDFGLFLLSEGTAHSYDSIHGGGADQWKAPELIDPEMFGLGPNKRQTFASDVYAFGCACVELYIGGPPFGTLNA